MFQRPITLHIYSSRTPYRLTIRNSQNQVLQAITILSPYTEVYLCPQIGLVKLIAQAGNQTLFRLLNLSYNFFHHMWVNLCFPDSQIQITLHNANYGFPVANATLHFQESP